jgi:hypothetical protein
MESELRIFEMDVTANSVALARSWLVHDRLPLEYTATRARRAISLKAVRHSNNGLWSFVMLPNTPLVSGLFPFYFYSSATCRRDSDISFFPAEGDRERRAVRPVHAPSPSACVRHSGESRSGRRVRRSGGSGSGSTRNKGTRNPGCVSSREFLPRRRRSTCRRERKRRKKATGGGPP